MQQSKLSIPPALYCPIQYYDINTYIYRFRTGSVPGLIPAHAGDMFSVDNGWVVLKEAGDCPLIGVGHGHDVLKEPEYWSTTVSLIL